MWYSISSATHSFKLSYNSNKLLILEQLHFTHSFNAMISKPKFIDYGFLTIKLDSDTDFYLNC